MTRRAMVDQVRDILRTTWDPIGVADVPEAIDEYDAYVSEIARQIMAGARAQDLAAHLARLERDMGLNSNTERALRVAEALARLR